MELKLKFTGFTGSITMRAATNLDRLKLMEKLSINIMDLVESKDDEEKHKNAVSSLMSTKNIIALIEASKDHYLEVALKKGKKEFTSFSDLNEDSECQVILMECATKALLGLGDAESKK